MAQHDTGLGWSALEEWLVQSGNLQVAAISELVGAVVLPTAISPVELVANGLRTQVEEVPGSYTSYWIVGTDPDTEVICFFRGTSPSYTLCFVGPQNAKVYVCAYDPQSQSTSSYQTKILNTSLDSFPGFYWNSGPGGYVGTYVTLNPDIPIYPSFSDAAQHISRIENPIYKQNAGYAVACLAKWYTQNGTFITSPILISSDTEYTDMSLDDPDHSIAKFNKLLQGTRFYMAFFDLTETESITSTLPVVDLTDRGNLTLEQVFMTIISTSYAHVIIIDSPDPYEKEGAESEEEGGDGEEQEDDDAGIEDGSIFPSAINTGFCRIFTPSESDLQNLSNYLWSNSYDLTQVKKLFSNPMDSILGLSAVPIRLLGSSASFSLGGVPITGMTLPQVSKQRYTYHMGTITVSERWGSYLDYDPYTKFSIFLPFIGMRDLSADDIMGKTVSLVYDIDILTGMCVARLQAGTNCLYEWGGNCAIQLPINSRNWDSVFSTAVSAVGGIMSAVTGGSAPLVAGSVASAALQTVSMKPRIDKSSTIGGAAGWLGQMTPYIIRTTPEAFIPSEQNKFIGYPAYINVNMGAISGYNEVESVHLENIPATGAELDEIETILKGGAIF